LLKRYAQEIDDELGSDLADLCLVETRKRKERQDKERQGKVE
jgi:hypothetical protein